MQITMIVIGVLIITFGFVMYRNYKMIKNTPMVADHEKIISLTDQNFQQQIKNKVVLVDFWASWCVPCRAMAPILNEVAGELKGNVYVGKLNIEQYQAVANKYNVRSIPTLVVFKNGNEIKRFVGVKNKDYLLKQLQDNY